MIPLSGMDMYNEMLRRNHWIYEYLPNTYGAPGSTQTVEPVKTRSQIQKGLELILSLPFGTWVENWERNRKIQRLAREQSHSFESYFSADVCKGHVDRHGENIATALNVRLQKAIESAASKTI
jgi:hypothetical protein